MTPFLDCDGFGGGVFSFPVDSISVFSPTGNAVSLFPLYRVINIIEPCDYDALCCDIKDGLPDWLDAMRRYDDMLDGLCDDDQDDLF